MGFPDSSAGNESAYNAGDPGSIPESGRSAGEGIGYPLQYSWASIVAQLVKNLTPVWVRSLGWEDPLEEGKATHSSILAWRKPWTKGVTKSWTRLGNFPFMLLHLVITAHSASSDPCLLALSPEARSLCCRDAVKPYRQIYSPAKPVTKIEKCITESHC